MPGWIFDLPLWIVGPVLVLATVAYALAGLWLVRRRVLPRLQISDRDSEFSGSLMQAVMVFYGLAVALIAVSVWQNHADVSRTVSQEATAIAAELADAGADADAILCELERLRPHTLTWAMARDISHAVRGGRIQSGKAARSGRACVRV